MQPSVRGTGSFFCDDSFADKEFLVCGWFEDDGNVGFALSAGSFETYDDFWWFVVVGANGSEFAGLILSEGFVQPLTKVGFLGGEFEMDQVRGGLIFAEGGEIGFGGGDGFFFNCSEGFSEEAAGNGERDDEKDDGDCKGGEGYGNGCGLFG